MKDITELGLTLVERIIGNNIWLLYNQLDENVIDTISALSISWEEEKGNPVIRFAVKKNGEWVSSSAYPEKDEDEQYDTYGTAIQLVGDIFGTR